MKFSTTFSAATLSVLSLARFASAHGYVQSITIGGKVYGGWLPFDSPYSVPATQSIVRNIPDDGPVTDITNAAMACNVGGEKAAALTADVTAGSDVKITWNRWPDDHKGPITLYMASCGGSCSSFDPSKGNVWFKIEQATLGSDGIWPTDKLIANGLTWNANIPSGLKAGEYLLRMEILALHSTGAPQFYPSCAQLNVKGGGSDVASGSSLVALPGAYANAGNAIYGDIWEQPTSWPVAGPAVVSFSDGSSGDDSTPATSAAASASTPAKTTAAAAASATGKASSAKPTGTASAPQTSATPKKCKAKKAKRMSTLESLVQAAKREDGPARSWASHSKAKRARVLLTN